MKRGTHTYPKQDVIYANDHKWYCFSLNAGFRQIVNIVYCFLIIRRLYWSPFFVQTHMEANGRIVLKGGRIVRGTESFVADVVICGDRIAEITAEAALQPYDKVINCSGRWVTAGLVDLHVHLREPDLHRRRPSPRVQPQRLTEASPRYARCSTSEPAPDSVENMRRETEIIERDAVINVLPYATITRRRAGRETVDFAALKPLCRSLHRRRRRRAERRHHAPGHAGRSGAGCIIAAHCEVNDLLHGGLHTRRRVCRRTRPQGHLLGERWRQIERDIALAEETGCRYHVCHISTKESVAPYTRGQTPRRTHYMRDGGPTPRCATTICARRDASR